MSLPTLAPDKAHHVLYGALVASLTASGALLLGAPPGVAAAIGGACAIAVGAVKELLDRRDPAHQVEVADAVATFAGGLVVIAPLCLMGVR